MNFNDKTAYLTHSVRSLAPCSRIPENRDEEQGEGGESWDHFH
jgi:hypothetical protein